MTGARAQPRIFTIPPGVPFLATFVEQFLVGALVPGAVDASDPAGLSAATIFVPTRRSARALADEFARAAKQSVVLLPRIVPLGHLEDIEAGLAFHDSGFGDAPLSGLPEAVSDVERRLVLTRMIIEWARALRYAIVSIDASGKREFVDGESLLVATSPAQAWNLSGDLASLIDDMTIEGVEWSALAGLAPENYDQYWRITLEFLKIATASWPAHLNERGLIDRAGRQMRLVASEIERLSAMTQGHPVIAIGSTGANPATARLLGAIARLPRGAIVLPGLDMQLDEIAWAMIAGDEARKAGPADGHPQAVLNRLLRTLGVTRADVVETVALSPALRARARFVSEAMRPADATHSWLAFARGHRQDFAAALEHVALIEAADEREEALCLAIEARRLLERDGATGALVTPDRALARRVKGELARWNIEVDDSAGDSLGLAPAGVLARLALAAAGSDAGNIDILALLSHPLARLSRAPDELWRLVGLLEIGVWRAVAMQGLAPAVAIENARLAAQTRDAHRAARAIGDDDWRLLQGLLEDIEAALAPLRAVAAPAGLAIWTSAHRATIARLLAPQDGQEDSLAIEELFDALSQPSLPSLPLAPTDYAALFEHILAETIVRSPRRAHPRFKILGPLEARLLHLDVVLLGGLDETVWPPAAGADPFLNRPMRTALGLGPPERRIGQSAHDFVEAMGAPRVVVSRARKRDGAPTVPSRFLQRMAALAGEDEWRQCLQRGQATIALAREIDAKAMSRIARPRPRPPLALRPTRLSVTRIETLRRDPYGIYAESILGLIALGPLNIEPGARETGNLLHEMTADFARAWPGSKLPDDALAVLRAIAEKKFAEMLPNAAFRAFHWPRIETALTTLLDWESQRRGEIAKIEVEQSGLLAFPLSDGSIFQLTAQADRVERRRDGTLAVIDFKSGGTPTPKEIAAGFAPQLTLETAMLERGAFKGIPAAGVEDALYVKILGGEKKAPVSLKPKSETLSQFAREHFVELRNLLDEFRDVNTPYIPRPYPQFINKFSAYDHLARVKEWSAGDGEGDET